MATQKTQEAEQNLNPVMNTYARLPVAFVRGEGSWVWDENGKRYLDALSGIAVNTLGHAHPRLVKDLSEQVATLIHTSNLYRVIGQEKVAAELVQRSGMSEVFFSNSGCEANEAAIKLARFYGHQKGIDNPAIIVMEHSFHGRTLATLSATGNRKVQVGFEPLVSGFVRVPYNDLDAVQRVAESNQNVVAVLLEIVQGEGGLHVADEAYVQGLRALCDAKGWLMMCDEVQCGMGRTGTWFGYQQVNVQPDVATMAKGLGSGVPVGACLAGGKAAGLFKPGNHGSTFGGNPLAMRAALTTIQVMDDEKLLENAVVIGERIRNGIRAALADVNGVTDIRGRGLMIGIELDRPCGELVARALEAGLLINVTFDKVVRLLPPLNFTAQDADILVAELSKLIRDFLTA